MRIYKNKAFARFARKESIADETLCEAIENAEAGKIDADLGGGLIKQRIARPNEGKRGGYRTIILYKKADKAFFVFGFAKNDEANFSKDEEKAYKKMAEIMLNLTDAELRKQIKAGHITEVKYHDKKK